MGSVGLSCYLNAISVGSPRKVLHLFGFPLSGCTVHPIFDVIKAYLGYLKKKIVAVFANLAYFLERIVSDFLCVCFQVMVKN